MGDSKLMSRCCSGRYVISFPLARMDIALYLLIVAAGFCSESKFKERASKSHSFIEESAPPEMRLPHHDISVLQCPNVYSETSYNFFSMSIPRAFTPD
jgi:hypothetical protein